MSSDVHEIFFGATFELVEAYVLHYIPVTQPCSMAILRLGSGWA